MIKEPQKRQYQLNRNFPRPQDQVARSSGEINGRRMDGCFRFEWASYKGEKESFVLLPNKLHQSVERSLDLCTGQSHFDHSHPFLSIKFTTSPNGMSKQTPPFGGCTFKCFTVQVLRIIDQCAARDTYLLTRSPSNPSCSPVQIHDQVEH